MRIKSIKIFISILFNTLLFSEIDVIRAFPNLQFDQPVDLQSPNDNSNRIFVLEQEGEILVFENLNSVSDASQFLDIRDKVEFQGEMGLLGLAFHPDYENNGYFFINYIAPNPRRTVIARYEVSVTDSNIANNESEVIILEIEQPYNNHNGGQIAFGPDEFLYIGMGDGGSGGDPLSHGQNLSTLLGAMLRIDINNFIDDHNYIIPFSNPYINSDEGYRQEIYAHGLRNPWRFSFDESTGNCWIADVGQDEYEEINILESGGNYGWSIMEGLHCFNPPTNCDTSGLILPIYEYDHSVGESITGGYVYRGTMVPSLIGKYIFADFEYGDIYALEHNDSNNIEVSNIGDLGPYSVTSFGIDDNNEIYICKLNGEIYKFSENSSQNCTADDGTDGIDLWGDCYSIDNTSGISLTGSEFQDTIPPQIGNLINLTSLEINWTEIHGNIPPEIGNLINLTTLTLTGNFLSGHIPPELGNLTNLTTLSLSDNGLSGSIPSELGNLVNLTDLNFFDTELSGEIPSEFCNLVNLTSLELHNCNLEGPIPNEIGNLINLTNLHLWNNYLEGDVPLGIWDLNNLVELDLSINQLTGMISPNIGSMTNLELLGLGENQMNGFIPESICELELNEFESIGLEYNQFCPPYPSCIEDYLGEQDTSNCENVSVSDDLNPNTYKLYSAYPNPFNPFTTLRYDLPEDEFVRITIYDMLGNFVSNLVHGYETYGFKTVKWNATNNQGEPVSAGVYFYCIEAGEFRQTKKMILLK